MATGTVPQKIDLAPKAPDAVYPGRYTAGNDQDLVVFLIGMRFNGFAGLRYALQAFVSMPRMLASLEKHPETGCLGGHVAFGWKTAYVMQYWRSFDDLDRFAKAPNDEHHPMWRWYMRLGDKARDTGIWHETFRVAAGSYESIYANMPRFGLAKATTHVPIVPATSTARKRIEASCPHAMNAG
jgi:hypothetical protein